VFPVAKLMLFLTTYCLETPLFVPSFERTNSNSDSFLHIINSYGTSLRK
jgi:hypothetical protein